jgi:predicted 3-demethylubiquinone-9 3-methyltransferase (glyoxalase superfamily)
MQKIVPYLWFNDQAEEAAKLYSSLFDNAKILSTARYGEAGPGPKGTVMMVTFQLEGQRFMALNGGPQYSFTPAISFFVTCGTAERVDALWRKLSDGGRVLMELQKYPFSEKFGWVEDRYGLSWQLNLAGRGTKISPFLMFVGKQQGRAEEAMKFYVSLFKDSSIEQIERFGAGQGETEGTVMHGRFSLAGQEFMAMDSAREHAFSFTPATSLYVNCDTQAEIDTLWEKLPQGGGEPGRCGWLTDRYGVSWQIVPSILGELMGDAKSGRPNKVMQALLKMNKLDIKELQRAYEG